MTETTFYNTLAGCVRCLTKLVEGDRVETLIVAGLDPQGWLYGERLDVQVFPGNMHEIIHAPKYRFQ